MGSDSVVEAYGFCVCSLVIKPVCSVIVGELVLGDEEERMIVVDDFPGWDYASSCISYVYAIHNVRFQFVLDRMVDANFCIVC